MPITPVHHKRYISDIIKYHRGEVNHVPERLEAEVLPLVLSFLARTSLDSSWGMSKYLVCVSIAYWKETWKAEGLGHSSGNLIRGKRIFVIDCRHASVYTSSIHFIADFKVLIKYYRRTTSLTAV